MLFSELVALTEVTAKKFVKSIRDGHNIATDPILVAELEEQRKRDYDAARARIIARLRA